MHLHGRSTCRRAPHAVLSIVPPFATLLLAGSHVWVGCVAEKQPSDVASEKIFPYNVPILQQNSSMYNLPCASYNTLGQLFSVTTPGNITGIRFFAAAKETGTHDAYIWRVADKVLLARTTIPATEFGRARWVQWTIGPVSVHSATEYMVSTGVGAAEGASKDCDWAGCPTCWEPAGNNGGHIEWPEGSARFCNGPACKNSMPGVEPQFGQSYFRDIVFCPISKSGAACGPLPPPPAAASLVVEGPNFVERPPFDPAHTQRRSQHFRASVLDQLGKPLPNDTQWSPAAWRWTVDPANSGVSIASQSDGAVLTVMDMLQHDATVLVTASLQLNHTHSITGSHNVAIQALAASGLTVTGCVAAGAHVETTLQYKVQARDQLGHAITLPAPVVWSVLSANTGVVVDASTGLLTVASSANPGVATIMAKAADVNGTIVLSIIQGLQASAFVETFDTTATLVVQNDSLYLASLRNPTVGWEWVSTGPQSVPLPVSGAATGTWKFIGKTAGNASTSFAFQNGALSLVSVWSGRNPGPGPVEHTVRIVNTASTPAVFNSSLRNIDLKVRGVNQQSRFHAWSKTGFGKPEYKDIPLTPGVKSTIPTGGPTSGEGQYIPFGLISVDDTHGMYVGSEWELGSLILGTTEGAGSDLEVSISTTYLEGSDQINISAGASNPDVASNFTVPSTYYGTFAGDTDDGTNSFKSWFWQNKVTRSLYGNAAEPWTEICWANGPIAFVGEFDGEENQTLYNLTAATGVEALKMDYGWYDARNWTWRPKDWPDGFDYTRKAHIAGMHTSLYMGGTYQDVDLNTIKGRDAELAAVALRYREGYMDMWRTDKYNAPTQPMPDTFAGVTNFLYIMDTLFDMFPGFRYENCANGGHFKGFALQRRFTFVTTNDQSSDGGINYRQTQWVNSHAIATLQLKSDIGPRTIDNTSYILRSSMLGSWLTAAPDVLHNPSWRLHLALYKTRQRPILRGADVYHILPMPDGVNYDGMQYYNHELKQGSVLLFKPSTQASGGDSILVPLKGLVRTLNYKLEFQDRTGLNAVMTGAQLMDVGLHVTEMLGSQASEIIWMNEEGNDVLVA